MSTHLDETNMQDLIRQTTPGPTRGLDHATLQHRGRRHRKIRHISAVAGAAALLGVFVLATPLTFPSVAVDPATGGPSDTSNVEHGPACPPQIEDEWHCITPSARQRVPNAQLPQLGDTPPLPDDMRDLEPQAVVLSAWATWCGPCTAQQPQLNGLASDVPDNVAVVGLATASPEGDVIEFRREHSINHPTLVDQDGAYLRQLQQIAGVANDEGEGAVPAAFVIDPSGRLAAWTFGHASAADLRIAADYAAVQ